MDVKADLIPVDIREMTTDEAVEKVKKAILSASETNGG